MAEYREVIFELVGNTAASELFKVLIHEPRSRAILQSIGLGPELASVVIDYVGPLEAVARLRGLIEGGPKGVVVQYDTLLSDGDRFRCVATWRRSLSHSEGVSLEHLLYDAAGPGALLFGRVERGVIAYKAASPGGRGLVEFVERVAKALDPRYRVRTLRSGPFRGGWDIDIMVPSLEDGDVALLITALRMGYYDEPKACGVREVAESMGASKSVIARRLRVIERTALERLSNR